MKKTKKPFQLILAQSDDLRVVQLGPKKFIVEQRREDRAGNESWEETELHTHNWVDREPRPALGGLVDLLRAVPGHSCIRAPWSLWAENIFAACVLFGLGVVAMTFVTAWQ